MGKRASADALTQLTTMGLMRCSTLITTALRKIARANQIFASGKRTFSSASLPSAIANTCSKPRPYSTSVTMPVRKGLKSRTRKRAKVDEAISAGKP